MRLVTALAIFGALGFGAGCSSSDSAGSGGTGASASASGTGATGAVGSSSGAGANGHAGNTSTGSAGTSTTGTGGASAGTGGSGTAMGGTAGSTSSGGSLGSAGKGGASTGGGTGGSGTGGTSAGGASGGMQPLKGLAFASTDQCADLAKLGVSWFYNWGTTTKCTGVEYVPQIWGDWTKLNWVPMPAKAVAGGAKYLLGFNEPDGAGQANMSVADALKLWASFDQPGVQLGSPAVAGEGWLPDFMTGVAAQKLRVDFIAVHWYGWEANTCNDTSQLEGKIKWAEQWQRPIWITEWSCRLQPADVVAKFYTDALAMLKKHPLVVRYAWFEARSGSVPNDSDFNNSALLDGSGNPTALGNEYIAAPSWH